MPEGSVELPSGRKCELYSVSNVMCVTCVLVAPYGAYVFIINIDMCTIS